MSTRIDLQNLELAKLDIVHTMNFRRVLGIVSGYKYLQSYRYVKSSDFLKIILTK